MTHFAPPETVGSLPLNRSVLSGHSAPPGATRMDMHCHSRASAAPVIHAASWVRAPECYSEPEEVYMQARARGMDLVTLTDHDTIAGALRLRELRYPGVLMGQEVTVRFPEDRCKLHVLVYDLAPDLDEEITTLGLRDDVYEFAAWLEDRRLPHALAHPLHAQSRCYRIDHLEKATLLFRAFELINGAHGGPRRDATLRYMRTLTPARINELSAKHGLRPTHPRAWEKAVTAGSDDHGLLNVGAAWTQVISDDGEKITDPGEFVRLVMQREASVGGDIGGPEVLAHQVASVGLRHYARTIHDTVSTRGRYAASKLTRFAGVAVPAPTKARLAAHIVKRKLRKPTKESSPLVRALRESMEPLLDRYPDLRARLHSGCLTPEGPALGQHDRAAEFASELSQALAELLVSDALAAASRRDASGMIRNLTAYGVTLAAHAPYLIAMCNENKERALLATLEHESARRDGRPGPLDRQPRVVMFTDTLADVNGVSRFIQNVADRAHEQDRDLTVVTSTRLAMHDRPNVRNFKPVYARPMPGYAQLELALPPLLPVLREVQRLQPDVINIATPGPVGALGLLCASIFRRPVVGVYHTDFPAFIDNLFNDETYTFLAQKAMRAFYSPFQRVMTRSKEYIRSLESLGFATDRIHPLLPGIDTETFHTRSREPSIWPSYGLSSTSRKVIYCGRVSVEKNLPMFEKVWRRAHREMRRRGVEAELVVIGDGPYRATMEQNLAGMQAHFLGFRHGEELSRLYASADLFCFPSVHDTLGQVVMEAQASGLPVIVTDEGGPKEMVDQGLTGFVIPPNDIDGWAHAIADLAENDEVRTRMGRAAHNRMQRYNIGASFEHFWQQHVDAHRESLRSIGVTPRDPGPSRPSKQGGEPVPA